ncbi:hypothetical protein N5D48_26105 [Pseudomonas sp. GD03858]|uniref:hypothetical protein n=1 Tax=unclassified Pseudomonas TaxID=196821 RepID=UPI00244A1C52|nr:MULTISPECIES: hypothetical protein [unclassified Pseudomonas]MDH0650327.1 hypothetical protein [Pseudomonas sp. GD03867]MDH0665880.1 hypothetical protein [Pseudomonas sp. GD03858]
MKLNITFPENLITNELLGQKLIPCVCKISKEFEVSFSETVPESSGLVSDWDRKELELRALAGGGGRYTHHANSLITLEKISESSYKIIDLEMFYRSYGWCAVIRGGEYAPPGDFWDEE